MEHVGLAQAAWSVDEKRVVLIPRAAAYGFRTGDGESVALTYNEAVKGKAWIRLETRLWRRGSGDGCHAKLSGRRVLATHRHQLQPNLFS